jgi:hypothetical protein
VGIVCIKSDGAAETCKTVHWSVDPSDSAAIMDAGGNLGTLVRITGAKGAMGRITAYVNGNTDHSCYLDFAVLGERQCWETS